jgi:hypothetical protein
VNERKYKMRYRAIKVSNVEEYLFSAIGDATPLVPKWELHSVVFADGIYLVILQTHAEILSEEEIKARAKALE